MDCLLIEDLSSEYCSALGSISSSICHFWNKHIPFLYSRGRALALSDMVASLTQALQTQLLWTAANIHRCDFLPIIKPVKYLSWCLEHSKFSINVRYCTFNRSGKYSINRLI